MELGKAFESATEAAAKLNEVLAELNLPDFTIQENLAADCLIESCLVS